MPGDMEELTELNSARDKAFQKIGRNVVAFQKMEAMLKFLIANHKIEGLPEQLLEIHKKNVNEVDRQTLGSLVDKLFRAVVADDSSTQTDPDRPDGAWSVSFSVDFGADGRSDSKEALGLIVKERNALIHQMMAKFDPKSLESCHSLISTLDAQRDKIKPHYESLRSMVNAVLDGRKELLEIIESEEFPRAIEEVTSDA